MAERQDDERRKQLRERYKQADRTRWQAQVPLDPDDLEALLDHLDEHVGEHGCDDTLAATEAWLGAHDHDVGTVTAGLSTLGGGCDCEVLANVDPQGQL